MVNTEEFIKRLHLILDYYGLSASAFADTIGVQRSGLSHLLSGRNKPSLEFIMRIVERYPDVDLYWLLNGKGSFPKDSTTQTQEMKTSPTPHSITNSHHDLFTANEVETDRSEIESDTLNKVISNSPETEIERIVIFYKNGSFKDYSPQ